MIKRHEYLEALDLIERYHRQMDKEQELIEKNNKKTPIREWEKIDECSRRLRNLLFALPYCKEIYTEGFIEDISTRRLKRLRGWGKKSIDEFIELRGY